MSQLAEIIYGDEDRPVWMSKEATMNSESAEEEMLGKKLVTINAECEEHLRTLREQLMDILKTKPPQLLSGAEQSVDHVARPFIWISKWVDYSNRFGFAYQLCNNGVGAVFLDQTRLLLLADQRNLHYIESDGTENYYTMDRTPSMLKKKVKLLSYFRRYMETFLRKDGPAQVQEFDQLGRIVYLQKWHRNGSAAMLQLSNGTLQINFGHHTKISMCPLMRAVNYTEDSRNFRTYKFSTIMKNGCIPGLSNCLEYACKEIENLLEKH